MAKVTDIQIKGEPVVVFPLKKWEEIQETLEELEEAARFHMALEESRKKKFTNLSTMKNKYKLK